MGDTIGSDAAWIIRILNDTENGAKARHASSGSERWRSARWLTGASGEDLAASGAAAEPASLSGASAHHGNA